MGSIVMARCDACDYKKTLMLGGGMQNFQSVADWPVWCLECGKLSVANHLEPPLSCSECGCKSVNRPEDPQVGPSEGQTIATWSLSGERSRPIEQNWVERLLRRPVKYETKSTELVLTNGSYRCPKCKEPSLRFHLMGHFD